MKAVWLLVGASLIACGKESCDEGDTRACTGSGGCLGTQSCVVDRKEFGTCSCEPTTPVDEPVSPAMSPAGSDPSGPPTPDAAPGESVSPAPVQTSDSPTADASIVVDDDPPTMTDDVSVTDESGTDVTDDVVTDDPIVDEAATDDVSVTGTDDPAPESDGGPPPPMPTVDMPTPYVPGTGPVVLFLVDQSSSMFAASVSEFGASEPFGAAEDNWSAVRMALGTLPPNSSETGVELGLTTYTGQIDGTCPLSQEIVVPGVNTSASVTRTLPDNQRGAPPFAGQTPTGEALEGAYQSLLQSSLPGSKHIVVITDGDPDTCLHPDPQCGQDYTVSIAQAAKDAGITTHVVGLTDGVGLNFLESLAYAGLGLPIPPPLSAEAQDCLARQTGSMGGSFDPNNWRASALARYASDDVQFDAQQRSHTPKTEVELAQVLQDLLVEIRDGD